MEQTVDLRYPIGKFVKPQQLNEATRREAIREISELPWKLRAAIVGLYNTQIEEPYRPDGWTVRQVIHHLADSHINGYTRFKLALTENAPTIKPYDEARWAELVDGKTAPIELSLKLLDVLHERWAMLLKSFSETDFSRTILHPDHGQMNLDVLLALYAWHGRHHVAHIMSLRNRMKW
jgi:hypothetical protein